MEIVHMWLVLIGMMLLPIIFIGAVVALVIVILKYWENEHK